MSAGERFDDGEGVRIAYWGDPAAFAGRLFVAKVTTIEEFRPDLVDRYRWGGDALVPDTSTIRPCTNEELGRIVVCGKEAEALDGSDPRNIQIIGDAAPPSNPKRACNVSLPNMLTTTHATSRNAEGRLEDCGILEGIHVDVGEPHQRRFGYVYGPRDRGLIIGTRSTEQMGIVNSEELHEAYRRDPEMVGHVLLLVLRAGDIYHFWTGRRPHDGTTVLGRLQSEAVHAGFPATEQAAEVSRIEFTQTT